VFGIEQSHNVVRAIFVREGCLLGPVFW